MDRIQYKEVQFINFWSFVLFLITKLYYNIVKYFVTLLCERWYTNYTLLTHLHVQYIIYWKVSCCLMLRCQCSSLKHNFIHSQCLYCCFRNRSPHQKRTKFVKWSDTTGRIWEITVGRFFNLSELHLNDYYVFFFFTDGDPFSIIVTIIL